MHLSSQALLLAFVLFLVQQLSFHCCRGWATTKPHERQNNAQTGFWYSESRLPESDYDTIPYANLSVRILQAYQDGPGQNLISDPFEFNNLLFAGNTIARQAFDTQFILDMNFALGIDVDRVFVMHVGRGTNHFSWESTSVIVRFVFLERNHTNGETLLQAVAHLTNIIQIKGSPIYVGTNVTLGIDDQYGLQVEGWDVSLQLTYPIDVVGGNAVIDHYYLNQGSMGICDVAGASNFSTYCEFERFFEDDVSTALNISYYRIQTMFIKSSAFDAVLVYFRISPPRRTQAWESDVATSVANLNALVADTSSILYNGNVTIRVDPLWGVSQTITTLRPAAAKFTLKYYEYDESRLGNRKRASLVTPYDRCKQNHRCNWGIIAMDQSTNDVKFYHQLYERGNRYGINLFFDFEDWRMGARGFGWYGFVPPTKKGATDLPLARTQDGVIRGAHFWPFDQDSLGPDVPCYLTERNQGLVLDRILQTKQLDKQEALVDDLLGRIEWLEKNIEWATMGAELRSRKDVRRNLTWVKEDFTDWWGNEVTELRQLNSSMCASTSVKCELTFNTSSLELVGAIEGTGVIRYTTAGTQVAVFSFNSIYLGPEVQVTLVGQRAFALVSKTTAIINTTFIAQPGTLGGMQGGGSVGRYKNDTLSDNPHSIYICNIGGYCTYTNATSAITDPFVSNNVNGQGSGNLRVTPFVITTSAEDFREVQVIKTDAQQGQTLAGGFTLHFKGYSTPIIPHDCNSALMKQIIETNLNLRAPQSAKAAPITTDRVNGRVAGAGTVFVSRNRGTNQEGYTWSVTFATSIGNLEQMTYTNYLQGLNANMSVTTARDGNELGGTYTLSYQGSTTPPIRAAETAEGLRSILLDLPAVTTAFVSRTDPTQNCDDGLCENGPNAARGLVWTVYVTSNYTWDDTTPTSPTSPLAQEEGFYNRFTASSADLTGVGAAISIDYSTAKSNNELYSLLTITSPFSLAWGGAGASYGGLGGAGYSEVQNPVGQTYNDRGLSDLLGGSGGCMRAKSPFEVNAMFGPTTGRGGHGGGAIEIIASNDVRIGTYGKIIMRGGDGEQSSEGGGGGGSGGAILLAAGATVYNEGYLDVSGGSGGFGGFEHLDMPGGGGGGGRIALFGESVTNSPTSRVSYNGGMCGVYKSPIEKTYLVLNITIHMEMLIPLDDNGLIFLASSLVNDTITPHPSYLDFLSIRHYQGQNSTLHTRLQLAPWIEIPTLTNVTTTNGIEHRMEAMIALQLNATDGVSIGQVLFLSMKIYGSSTEVIYPQVAQNIAPCSNPGNPGTFFTQSTMQTSMYVAETLGAENTTRALFFSNDENTNTSSGSAREAPYPWNGPIHAFEPSRPTRVTYYTKLGIKEGVSTSVDYGALFSLLSHGEPGLNTSNVIGVYLGQTIMHGANFDTAVDESTFLKRLVTIQNYPSVDRWYKISIHIQWKAQTYYIAIDDTIVVKDAPFRADDVDGIRLSVMRACVVWYDEIYVGFDNTMEYQCPTTSRDKGTVTLTPPQKHWSLEELVGPGSTGFTEYYDMTRHYNALDPAGSVHFDGSGNIKTSQDIKQEYPSGDYPVLQGQLHAGALVYITNSARSARTSSGRSATTNSPIGGWYSPKDGFGGAGDGRQYWYSEYNYISALTSTMNGGVAACSSQDLLTWRFEGIVFHYANASDMVGGSPGPFALERPKVKFNSFTNSYVMWAVMDNRDRTLAMSCVLASPFEDGPFLFQRSFYPDGNKTRDQVVFLNDEGQYVLGRTYYQTVEFLVPETVMQPVWESVKGQVPDPVTGKTKIVTNFASNYERSNYSSGYDNFHDIYIQRWRKEDMPWKIICRDKITGEENLVPYGEYRFKPTLADGTPDLKHYTVCIDPQETKVIIGQGSSLTAGPGFAITTQFLSPNSSINSWWVQTSVPSIKAQPWASSYRDGYCGIRRLDDGYDILDPTLADFVVQDRSTCSNIADNPTHASQQDKYIGVQRIIASRRAKYMAISQLTPDMLDTTGNLNSFEGELLSGDLISMIIEMGQFGFGAGNTVQSTFRPPIRSEFDTAADYKTRFYQYIRNHNDRAIYSLACVVDKVCPVNFRDQLTSGNI